MSCANCTAAAQGPHFGFTASCRGCKARAIATGPDFHRCRLAGKQDWRYRELLGRASVSHADVVRASEAEKERPPA